MSSISNRSEKATISNTMFACLTGFTKSCSWLLKSTSLQFQWYGSHREGSLWISTYASHWNCSVLKQNGEIKRVNSLVVSMFEKIEVHYRCNLIVEKFQSNWYDLCWNVDKYSLNSSGFYCKQSAYTYMKMYSNTSSWYLC